MSTAEFVQVKILNDIAMKIMDLNGSTGQMRIGGGTPQAEGIDGEMMIFNRRQSIDVPNHAAMIWMSARSAIMRIRSLDNSNNPIDRISLDAGTAAIQAGGRGRDGSLGLFDSLQDLLTASPKISLNSKDSEIILSNQDNGRKISLNGWKSSISMLNSSNKEKIILDASDKGEIALRNSPTEKGISLVSFPEAVTPSHAGEREIPTRVKIDGGGVITLRNFSSPSQIRLSTLSSSTARISIEHRGKEKIVLNGGANGLVRLSNDSGETIVLDAQGGDLTLGKNGTHGQISLRNSSGTETLFLNAQNGDIVLSNADCAEEFDIVENEEIEPGDILVLDDEEEDMLRKSTASYDKKVAGVYSGAGGYKAALTLDKKKSKNKRVPVALMGKVFCKAISDPRDPIQKGDMLTTSDIPGHAMKATDPLRSFGTTIGKALKPIQSGKGLIPIIVMLK
jgi:hypothetical protein